MKKTNIDFVEDTGITLDTILGLSQTINDLLKDNILLLTEYPNADKDRKYQANRLADKLLALASATTSTTEKAKKQLETATKKLLKGGVNND